MRRLDLVGQKFGRLLVTKFTETRNGNLYWETLCDCGNKSVVAGMSLKKGTTRSCGCLHKELASERKKIDLTGQKFGRLTALSFVKKGKWYYWKCECRKTHYHLYVCLLHHDN